MTAQRTPARSFSQKTTKVGSKFLAEARALFVHGEVQTIAQLAKATGIKYDVLAHYARVGDWFTARDQYLETLRRKADEKSADIEASAIAAARKLAWAGATHALKAVLERMRKGDMTPNPRDAKALVDSAITLHQLRAVGLDDEAKRELRALPLPELARKLKAEVEAKFGPIDDPAKTSNGEGSTETS